MPKAKNSPPLKTRKDKKEALDIRILPLVSETSIEEKQT